MPGGTRKRQGTVLGLIENRLLAFILPTASVIWIYDNPVK